MTTYFARMCFVTGTLVGTLIGGLSEQYDWPFMPTFLAGIAIYIGGSVAVELLGRRIQRKAEQAPVVPGRES